MGDKDRLEDLTKLPYIVHVYTILCPLYSVRIGMFGISSRNLPWIQNSITRFQNYTTVSPHHVCSTSLDHVPITI